ncbi:MAG TPA: serine/threonine-protein kinase [Myxococcales bacterium]|nr:serine/threonine-protein kinase [Myxococcales bacterium]
MVSGMRVGRYTLLGKLATGGMAEVFLARQEGPEGFAKTVVVKRILPHLAQDESFVRMFLNEARLAAVINHPNVVSIFELGQDAETESYYMAMEFIDGCNLKRIVHDAARTRSRFAPELCARVIADACAGLDYAHNLKGEDRQPLHIVHRDISPENVLVTYSGLVKVVDFGIAKAASIEGKTQAGQIKGKFGYMPPEQLLGEPLDRRADVWALGVVLYWLCAGVKPFSGENEAVIMQKILGSEPEPLDNVVSGIPRRLAEVVHTALAKEPKQRYESARALQDDLEAWIAQEGLVATNAALSDYMNDHFPEATDRDRMLVRALQSGEIQQGTPSDTDLLQPFKSISKRTAATVALRAGATPPPSSPARSMLLAGALTGGLVALGAVGLIFVLKPGAPVVPIVAPVTQEPSGTAKPPHPASPPLGERGPSTATATPTPTTTTTLTPTATPTPTPTTTPSPTATTRKHHRRHTDDSAAGASGDEGSIAFRVSPWATVYVDGQRVGTTPLQPLDVPAGPHRVKLVNDPLHAERTMTITVRGGETFLVKAMLGDE